jgi:hypothetical protein
LRLCIIIRSLVGFSLRLMLRQDGKNSTQVTHLSVWYIQIYDLNFLSVWKNMLMNYLLEFQSPRLHKSVHDCLLQFLSPIDLCIGWHIVPWNLQMMSVIRWSNPRPFDIKPTEVAMQSKNNELVRHNLLQSHSSPPNTVKGR